MTATSRFWIPRNPHGCAALALISAGWLGCGGDPAPYPALVDIVPAGAQCPNGGVEVHYGLDRDRDGMLDAGERERSEVACDEAPVPALVRVDAEPAGANCAFGGRAVRTGLDLDRDGTLQDDEIEATEYVCDATPAPAPVTLVRVDAEPAGARCAFGGRAVHAGLDGNGNGVLDDAEITSTEYLCDQGAPAGFTLLARYRIPTGTAAEIVAASPDGVLLAYTDSVLGAVAFVDVSDPARPVLRDEVVVSDAVSHPGAGQPTSVAFTPDGRYAVAAVKDTTDPVANADPGALVFIDTGDLGVAGSVVVGVGPDSLAITPDGARAIVAIEDEEDTEELVGQPQARPGSVQVVTIDAAEPSASPVQTIALALDVGNNQSDPQPEYVGLSRDGTMAVVSLQENNALAVIDLAVSPPRVLRFIDAGVVQYLVADLIEDDEVVFAGAGAQARREPDGVCVLPDGRHVVTANEGDTNTDDFVAGQLSGGRSFSIVDVADTGKVVFEAGAELELAGAASGMYPDSRSENRGIEVEGCHVAEIGGRVLAFLLGERNSAVYVYDVTEPESARLLQLLPAPMLPESAVTFGVGGPHGALLAVAGEGDASAGMGGSLWIYRAVLDAAAREQYAAGLHRAISGAAGVALGSVSGVAYAGDTLLAMPDRGFAAGRIWRLAVDEGQSRVRVVDEIRLRDGAGVPIVGHDPEGLAVSPEGGFVVATEGRRDNGGAGSSADRRNQLQFYDDGGRLEASVDLPDPETLWPRLPADGFSGAAVVDTDPAAAGGLVAYVSFRRPLDGGGPEADGNLARIGAYDVDAQAWSFFFYPLEPDLLVGDPPEILLADIVHLGADRFAVLERDQLDGGAAQVKRVYTFTLGSGTPGDTGDPLDKTLAVDLLAQPFAFDFAGVEALAAGGNELWVANDNDAGALATFFLQVAAP
jgi:DNA-binding beta-propeller fold protein YncE